MQEQNNAFSDAIHRAKHAVAQEAAGRVESGMKVGLGSGSTAEIMIGYLGERVKKERLAITCTATSVRSERLARECGLAVAALEQLAPLDIIIDGTDEFDANFTLIKGGGGAHLREKIVATHAKRMIVIADISKQVSVLGKFPLPVEITPFAHAQTSAHIREMLENIGYARVKIAQRMKEGAPFTSDEGNYIYDMHLEKINAPQELDSGLLAIAGVVETGLFIDMCHEIILGREDGDVKTLKHPLNKA